MDTTLVIDAARRAIGMALWLGAPALLTAVVVGLLVGVAQTLTQMNDPVVGAVARVLAVVVVVALVLPWLLSVWMSYASGSISSIPDLFGG